MRSNLIRVNIILTKEQHQRFKNYAKRYHGSLSQFLRLAAENEIDNQEDANSFYFRPMIENQEKIIKSLNVIAQQIKKIERIPSSIQDLKSFNNQSIASEIEHILLMTESPLSVPDIMEFLTYSQEEIIEGIEWLLDRCLITQIKRINAPSKYKLRGDTNE